VRWRNLVVELTAAWNKNTDFRNYLLKLDETAFIEMNICKYW